MDSQCFIVIRGIYIPAACRTFAVSLAFQLSLRLQALDADSSTLYVFGGVTQLSPSVDESSSLWILDLAPLLVNASSTQSPLVPGAQALDFGKVPQVALEWQQLRQPIAAASSTGSTNALLTSACSWPPARNSARMSILEGHVVLAGGLVSSASPDVTLRDMWLFQPGTSTWARYANLPGEGVSVSAALANFPPTRYAHSLNTVPDSLFRLQTTTEAEQPSTSRVLRNLRHAGARTSQGPEAPPNAAAGAAAGVARQTTTGVSSVGAGAAGAPSLVMFGGRYIASTSSAPVLGDVWVFDRLATSNPAYQFAESYVPSSNGWAHAESVGPGQAVGPITPWAPAQLQACLDLVGSSEALPTGATPLGNGPPNSADSWPLGRWRRLDVPGVQFERAFHASAVWNSTLFLFGGFSLVASQGFIVGAVFGDTIALPDANDAIGVATFTNTIDVPPALQLGWQRLQPQSLANLAGVADATASAAAPSERFEATGVFLPAPVGEFVNVTATRFDIAPGGAAVPAFVVYGGAFDASKGDVWGAPSQNASWRAVRESDFALEVDGIVILDSTVFMIALFSVVGLCFVGLAVGLVRRNRQRREMLAMLEDLMQTQALQGGDGGSGSDGPRRREPGVPAALLEQLPAVEWRPGVPPPTVPTSAAQPVAAAAVVRGGAAVAVPGGGYLFTPPLDGWTPPLADQTACSVCLDDFADSAGGPKGGGPSGASRLTVLPCGHVFHRTCIRKWLGNHDDCPLCKSDVARGIRGGSESDSAGSSADSSDEHAEAEQRRQEHTHSARSGEGQRPGGRIPPGRRSLQGSVRTVQVNPASTAASRERG